MDIRTPRRRNSEVYPQVPELGRFVPGRRVKSVTQEFTPVFYVTDYTTLTVGGTARIAVTSNHAAGYLDQLAVLDPKGQVVGEYWHSGHLRNVAAADLDRDEVPELVLEGVNDGYGQATLVVIDPRHVSGASVQPEGDFRQLQGSGRGSEKAIVFFPRTCVSDKRFAAFNRAFQMQVGADYILVAVSESIYEREGVPYLIYELDHQLKPLSVMVSSIFETRHRELEEKHLLDHAWSPSEAEQLRKLNIARKGW